MVRAMCGQKIVDRKTTEEQMDMLGLKETIDRLKVGLKKEDALRRDKWRDGVREIAEGMG